MVPDAQVMKPMQEGERHRLHPVIGTLSRTLRFWRPATQVLRAPPLVLADTKSLLIELLGQALSVFAEVLRWAAGVLT